MPTKHFQLPLNYREGGVSAQIQDQPVSMQNTCINCSLDGQETYSFASLSCLKVGLKFIHIFRWSFSPGSVSTALEESLGTKQKNKPCELEMETW